MLILRDTRRSPRMQIKYHLPPLLSPLSPSIAYTKTLAEPSLKPYTKPPPIRSVLRYNRKPELAGTTLRVVVITSGKGGVGKTTTTANVGLSLARLGFSVNYTVVEVLNGDCRIDQALVHDKRWSNFELLCISKPSLTKDLATLDNILEILETMGYNEGLVRYIGGLRILISFSNPSFAKRFLEERRVELSQWFSQIDVWNGQHYVMERIMILKVYGVPAIAWDAVNFNSIREKFVQVVHGSSTSHTDCYLTYEKSVILTPKLQRITEDAVLNCGNHKVKIHVTKVMEDWVPSFLITSPESIERQGLSGDHEVDVHGIRTVMGSRKEKRWKFQKIMMTWGIPM
ncbi:hypothetical protein R6Q57_012019 [Mikania cordata]